jgi:hypothetical protein
MSVNWESAEGKPFDRWEVDELDKKGQQCSSEWKTLGALRAYLHRLATAPSLQDVEHAVVYGVHVTRNEQGHERGRIRYELETVRGVREAFDPPVQLFKRPDGTYEGIPLDHPLLAKLKRAEGVLEELFVDAVENDELEAMRFLLERNPHQLLMLVREHLERHEASTMGKVLRLPGAD